MLKYRTERVINLGDWDNLVTKTYNRPYDFQQQDGCKERGVHRFTVPAHTDDYQRDTIPEIVNDPLRGVSFSAWLARDPKQKLEGRKDAFGCDLWWSRNFYPDMQMIANDLHARGLLEAGEYIIEIDW